MYKKGLFLIGIILAITTSQAQVAMGKWRTHFAYNSITQVTQSENKVFAVSEGSLFSVDKRDGNMEFYSKISGLNGTTVAKIAYDEVSKNLLITYSDGNIDFMSANGVKNLPDYYNKQMSVDKAVNHILFDGEKAYLSCNFGIIMLNMPKMEIRDTYYIGANASEVKVLNTTTHKGYIYAVSETDIYLADLSNPFIINYESWSKMVNLPGNGNLQALHSFNDELVLQRGGKLYRQEATGNWNVLDESVDYTSITLSKGYLIAFTYGTSYAFDKQYTKTKLSGLSSLKDAVYDEATSKFWLGSNYEGVVEYTTDGINYTTRFFQPNGPVVNTPNKLKFAGEKLFVLPGGKWVGPLNRAAHVMMFKNNTWENITQEKIQKSLNKDIEVRDFSSVAVDPDDDTHYYISSASTGIYEFKNNKVVQHFDLTNSNIEMVSTNPDYYYQWVDNIVFDSNKNLWFTNDLVATGIKVLLADGTWDKFEVNGVKMKQSLGEIFIPNLYPTQKWILSRRHGSGLCIFDDKGTFDNKTDDNSIFYSSFSYSTSDGIQNVQPEYFFCIEEDKNGTIWVGTDKGPVLFTSPSKVFDDDFMGSRVIIPRNDGSGKGDYLLEDQSIKAIAIDGANRKWLGTEHTGVYLMSENGQETIYHFTTKNSPLPSDNILSIAINPVSGEVFIGTGNGLVSFQSDAAEAGDAFKNVHVYPNPVRETHSGLITITGLIENTTVKITDVAGNLVSETKSNGSIATWDGKNKFGQKVNTGIYLAICVSDNGEQSATVKILVVN